MTIEIKSWYTNRVLYSSDKAKDIKECLEEAVAAGANLQDANLQYANLQSAKLQYANLQDANLQSANLQSANLQSAKLQDANGFNKYLVQPLLMLLDQPGKLRFYKCVTERLTSPTQTHMPLTYDIGTKLSVDDADCDEYVLCGAGINVATLDWIMREYPLGGARYRIVIIECKADDIACVPVATDGKIRLHRGKVVGELDYERYGLTVPTFAGKTSKQVIGG